MTKNESDRPEPRATGSTPKAATEVTTGALASDPYLSVKLRRLAGEGDLFRPRAVEGAPNVRRAWGFAVAFSKQPATSARSASGSAWYHVPASVDFQTSVFAGLAWVAGVSGVLRASAA